MYQNRFHIVHSRLGIVTLIPTGRGLVCLNCLLGLAEFYLVQLRQVLLVRGCSPEIALQGVMIDGLIEHSCRVVRVGLPVCLEGLHEGIGRIIRLVQVFSLNRRSPLKGKACFLAYYADIVSFRQSP